MKTIIGIIIAILVAWGIWWLVWGKDKTVVNPDDNTAAETYDANVDLSGFDSKG